MIKKNPPLYQNFLVRTLVKGWSLVTGLVKDFYKCNKHMLGGSGGVTIAHFSLCTLFTMHTFTNEHERRLSGTTNLFTGLLQMTTKILLFFLCQCCNKVMKVQQM